MRIPLIALAVLVGVGSLVSAAPLSHPRGRASYSLAQHVGSLVSAAPLSHLPTVTVIPPAADLPADVTALSGIWEGVWDDGLPSRLAVEALERDSAVVVYAWADSPDAPFHSGWIRRRVPVLPGGMLEWA